MIFGQSSFDRVYGSFRCVLVLFVNYVKIKLQFFAADTRLFFKWDTISSDKDLPQQKFITKTGI